MLVIVFVTIVIVVDGDDGDSGPTDGDSVEDQAVAADVLTDKTRSIERTAKTLERVCRVCGVLETVFCSCFVIFTSEMTVEDTGAVRKNAGDNSLTGVNTEDIA